MAKIDIPNIVSGYASTTALNNAFNSIETELNNKVLYRNNPNGEPNQMENNLDMNGFNILNLNSLEVGGIDVGAIATQVDADATAAAASALAASNSASAAAISAASAEEDAEFLQDFGWEGSWQTGVLYKVSNIVREAGVAYICLEEHTSGTFSTDLIANKWEVFAEKGAAGTGTGDMLAANNLSDVSDVPTARANLGLGVLATQGDGDKGDITVGSSGTSWTIDNNVVTYAKMQDVSATSRILGRKTALAGDTEECTLSEVLDFVGSPAQGDILYRGASTWTKLGAGTSGQVLKTQGVGANPIWDSVGGITSATAQSASGTFVDFTSIPSGVKRITVMFNGVSTNGSSNLLIQLGDAGGFETTGYASYSCKLGGTSVTSGGVSTSGFIADIDTTSSSLNGSVFISKLSGNIWVANGFLTDISNSLGMPVSGSKTLSDVLTSIRITTSNGAETFDAGTINIMYE
jgi:hypothetical protein